MPREVTPVLFSQLLLFKTYIVIFFILQILLNIWLEGLQKFSPVILFSLNFYLLAGILWCDLSEV